MAHLSIDLRLCIFVFTLQSILASLPSASTLTSCSSVLQANSSLRCRAGTDRMEQGRDDGI